MKSDAFFSTLETLWSVSLKEITFYNYEDQFKPATNMAIPLYKKFQKVLIPTSDM